MSAADFFYYSAGIAVWVGLTIIAYTAWQLVALARRITDRTEQVVNQVSVAKESLKFNVLSMIAKLIGAKRG